MRRRSPLSLARIIERLAAVLRAALAPRLVESARESGAVYVTPDLALPPLASDPGLPPRLAQRYIYAPRGLVFELASDAAFVDPASPEWASRAVFRSGLDPPGRRKPGAPR